MSNSNVRPFDLNQAIAGHPLVCRNGKPAKFIAYVAEATDHTQLIATIENQVALFYSSGKWADSNNWRDLFLAPLGHCEGKPVWPGDVLTNKHGNLSWTVTVGAEASTIAEHFWPKPKHVVETRMTLDEIGEVYNNATSVKDVANKAIERAIKDGDVIPMSSLIDIVHTAFNKHASLRSNSFAEYLQDELKEYKEGLK